MKCLILFFFFVLFLLRFPNRITFFLFLLVIAVKPITMAYLNALLPKDQDLDAQLPVENHWASIMQKYNKEHVPPEGASAVSGNSNNATATTATTTTTDGTTTSTTTTTAATTTTSVTTSATNVTPMTSTPPAGDAVSFMDKYDFYQMFVDSSGDSEAIDNPYLRAVKPPRKKKR